MALVGNFNQQLNPRRGVVSFGLTPPRREPHLRSWSDWATSSYSLDTDDTLSVDKDIGDEVKFEERILGLARQFTKGESELGVEPKNAFLGEADSALDPNSANFNSKAWIKNLLANRTDDPDRFPNCSVGVLFKDLSVHGFGSPTDFQKDVLNVTLEIGTLFRYMMGTAKQRIQILRGFDGLIRSGEMLVVLGRPGRYACKPLSLAYERFC